MIISIYNTKFIIYKHTNTITSKSYIGKTTQGMNLRWNHHVYSSIRNDTNSHFHKSIRKYGIDCWKHEILYQCFYNNDEHLYEVEEQLISEWDTFHNGYNLDSGGVRTKSGAHNTLYNKKLSKEHKSKISKSLKGKICRSNEYRLKMSNSKSGTNNHNFSGYCMYDDIEYISSELSEFINIDKSVILRWCKNSLNIITPQSYNHSKFLQSLGTKEEIVGKTFADIGFGFNPK